MMWRIGLIALSLLLCVPADAAGRWNITQITNDNVFDDGPSISGSRVVWSHGVPDPNNEIYLWDGVSTTQIPTDSVNNYSLSISGSNVAWSGMDFPYLDYEIYFWDGVSVTKVTDNTRTTIVSTFPAPRSYGPVATPDRPKMAAPVETTRSISGMVSPPRKSRTMRLTTLRPRSRATTSSGLVMTVR